MGLGKQKLLFNIYFLGKLSEIVNEGVNYFANVADNFISKISNKSSEVMDIEVKKTFSSKFKNFVNLLFIIFNFYFYVFCANF